MALTLVKKYYWLNSLGDMKTATFDTIADAETWIIANGLLSHNYVLITEYHLI